MSAASVRAHLIALRRAAGPAGKTLLLRSGLFRVLRTVRPNNRLGILRYHAVCDPDRCWYAEPAICISPAGFERQVSYLTQRYRVLSLPDAVNRLKAGLPLPPNGVALTFDDGYADNLEAAKILHRCGATGTFYLTAGCLSGDAPFWPSELRRLVELLPGPSVELDDGSAAIRIPTGTRPERLQALGMLKRLFKSRPVRFRERIRERLRSLAGNPRVPSPMLTWEQTRELVRLGMTAGAHTLSHANLPSATRAEAVEEIQGSKRRLESELGVPVTMFSYPNGGAERYYTPELQQLVQSAGFEAATTSRSGFAGRGSDPYALERVRVTGELEDLAFELEIQRFLVASGQ